MVRVPEADDYNEFDEIERYPKPIHKKSGRHKLKIPKNDSLDNQRQVLLRQIRSQLVHNTPNNPALEVGQEELQSKKQTYLTWLELSIADKKPLIDMEKDFTLNETGVKKKLRQFTCTHVPTGIFTRYYSHSQAADLTIQAKLNLVSQIDQHFGLWIKLQQMDSENFNVNTILDTISEETKD